MFKKTFFVSFVALLFSTMAMAQDVILKAKVIDADTSEPLIGASVVVKGTSKGTVTDIDGHFTLNASKNDLIVINYIGYQELTKKITKSGKVNWGIVKLKTDAVILSDVTITSQMVTARKTPVAASTIKPAYIEEKLGSQEFPEILKSTPGVYTTKQGGGFGDSEIILRGFKTQNIAVMVNGVPMNDMENGNVYWSNWAGVADVTRSMQTQRGLGASKVSAPSVGGSLNIVTKSTDAERGGFASVGMDDFGRYKLLFSVSTGLLDNGWAVTLLGGKTYGEGYIQGTEVDAYNYFLNVAKRIGDNQQLSFTVFGAPQIHGQRSKYNGLSIQGWQDVEQYTGPERNYRYNPTFGYDKNGQARNSATNRYHKPQFSLNHIWDIDAKSSLSSVLYMSIGDGYGYSGQTTDAYKGGWYGVDGNNLSTRFRKADGTFAYDEIQELNEQSQTGSEMVMSVSKNQHKWFGLLSTYNTKIGDHFDFYGGVDGRYYIGTHTNQIIDLYNGQYYVDSNRAKVNPDNNSAAADPAWVNQKLSVGDVIYRDYDGYVMQGGIFSQLEYNTDRLSAFVNGSINEISQWRYDRFYYEKSKAESDKLNSVGFNIKGGVNFNIDKYNNVFVNLGTISRAPTFQTGAFIAYNSNEVNKDAVNEKIYSFELGYGFKSSNFRANVNAYHTMWADKTMAKSFDLTNGDRGNINMQGVDATHRGVELDFEYNPFKWWRLTGMFSLGDWTWTNNPTGYFYDSNGHPLKDANGGIASGIEADDHASVQLVMDDVKVGGAAQTTAALGTSITLPHGFKVGLDWTFSARNYADFDIKSNDLIIGGEPVVYTTPWRIPSSSVFDLSASYKFNIGGLESVLSANVNNLFDQEYITSAYDGEDHTWQTASRVFYGFGRTGSIRLKVNF